MWTLFISLTQAGNGKQFLRIDSFLFLSAAISAAIAPFPTTIIVLSKSMYASLFSVLNLDDLVVSLSNRFNVF